MFRQKNLGGAAKAQLTKLFNDEMGLLAALIGTLFIMRVNILLTRSHP